MLDHLNVSEEIDHFAKTPLVQLQTGKVLRQNIFEAFVFFSILRIASSITVPISGV